MDLVKAQQGQEKSSTVGPASAKHRVRKKPHEVFSCWCPPGRGVVAK